MDIQSSIMWMDETLMVINKPAGLLSIPDGYDQTQPYLQQLLKPMFGPIWIVHRLDRDTSGVMVVTRTAEAHHLLNDQFSSREVHKEYHAMVAGSPAWKEQLVEQPLRKNGDRHHRTVVDPVRGKPAATEFKVVRRFAGYTLLQAFPHTGYTHQIRAHLAFLQFPIVEDALYRGSILDNSDEISPSLISRMALHARSISFQHPITGLPVEFTAPYPQDFRDLLTYLKGNPRRNQPPSG